MAIKLRTALQLIEKGYIAPKSAAAGLRELADQIDRHDDCLVKWSISIYRSLPIVDGKEKLPNAGGFTVASVSYSTDLRKEKE